MATTNLFPSPEANGGQPGELVLRVESQRTSIALVVNFSGSTYHLILNHPVGQPATAGAKPPYMEDVSFGGTFAIPGQVEIRPVDSLKPGNPIDGAIAIDSKGDAWLRHHVSGGVVHFNLNTGQLGNPAAIKVHYDHWEVVRVDGVQLTTIMSF